MACNKFLRRSHFTFNTFSYNLSKFNSKNSIQLLPQKSLANRIFHYEVQCRYSTVICLNKKDRKKCFLQPIPNLAISSLLLSTEQGKDSFQVVYTNPSTPSTEFSTDLSNVVDVSKSVSHSGFANTTEVATTVSEDLQNVVELVEPALSSLGLANNTPVGLVQMLLEYLHISLHMPWWMAITASTLAARILLLPILIKTQRNTITMSNHMPQLQFLQAKFGEARRSGNTMEASRYAAEIVSFMKEHNISPVKNALLPMCQAPVFISFFLGLRGMAKAPVESMKDGGLWWATDLTIPDPYYIMPVVACGTLYIVLKIGAESGVKLENMKLAKYFVQALPIVALPFTIHFPSAVLYYWCTTNFCTLAIVSILKVPPVRKLLKLPSQQPIDPKFVAPKKGFMAGVKEAYEDQKVLAAVEDRRRIDEIKFQKAGIGPIPRTYSYDPTKVRPSSVAAAAQQSRQTASAKEHKT